MSTSEGRIGIALSRVKGNTRPINSLQLREWVLLREYSTLLSIKRNHARQIESIVRGSLAELKGLLLEPPKSSGRDILEQ